MHDVHYLFAPITKADKATRTIEGPISGPDNLDLDRQIVDASFLRRAVGPWFKYGNIREQHIPTKAVGKAKTVDVGPDGVPVITAKIVDEAAWAKVEEGIYSGFSVGIKNARIVKDADAPNGRIVDGDLVEVSIVDHPANPMAKFAICKAAQSGGWVDLQNGVVIEGATQEKSVMPEPTPETTPVLTPPADQEDKTAMKDAMSDTTPTEPTVTPAVADETKAADDFMCGEATPEKAAPTPAGLTMGRSVETLLHDAKSALEALATSMAALSTGPAEHNSALAQNVATPAQSWTGGDLFRVKEVVAELLKEILPDMVQQELTKSFGSADLLTKGASPDAVKAAVQSIAESAVAAAVEPVVKRLETVEQMAAPMQGVAHTRDVEKSFAGNREKPALTFDQAAELVKGLPEGDRMKAAIEIIGQAQRQPMEIFRRS